eukprot:210276-Pelagomonas_calceolata.AAC.2
MPECVEEGMLWLHQGHVNSGLTDKAIFWTAGVALSVKFAAGLASLEMPWRCLITSSCSCAQDGSDQDAPDA